jgi:hypothetical protein
MIKSAMYLRRLCKKIGGVMLMGRLDYRFASDSDVPLIRSLMRQAFAEYQNTTAPSSSM